jgi:hypothetical protein
VDAGATWYDELGLGTAKVPFGYDEPVDAGATWYDELGKLGTVKVPFGYGELGTVKVPGCLNPAAGVAWYGEAAIWYAKEPFAKPPSGYGEDGAWYACGTVALDSAAWDGMAPTCEA